MLLNAATAASLVLCVATAVFWVRSYAVEDYVGWSRPAAAGNLWSTRGEVVFVRVTPHEGRGPFDGANRPFHIRFPPPAGASLGEVSARRVVPGLRRVAGFAYGAGAIPSYAGQAWIVPLWAPCAASAILPAIAAARLRLRRRLAARRHLRFGRCPTCGYDLRATPDRCPECGTIAAG